MNVWDYLIIAAVAAVVALAVFLIFRRKARGGSSFGCGSCSGSSDCMGCGPCKNCSKTDCEVIKEKSPE